MRKIAIINTFLCMIFLCGIANAVEVNIERGMQFSVHEIKGINYAFPVFRVAVISPDGSIIGWDKKGDQWTGNIISSEVDEEPFDFPNPGQECTSNEPSVERNQIISADIKGKYTTLSALYCKDISTGENSFTGSAYGYMMTGPDGKYSVVLYPEKHAIVDTCYGYSIYNDDSYNDLCVDPKFLKNVVITPGVEQTIEFTYNYTDKAANKVEKVVTPATLSGSWESCYQMGMIKNSGLYNSIKQKLDNASRKTASGDQNAAANIYSAVANELKAQYGKGIDAMCADILLKDLKSDVR